MKDLPERMRPREALRRMGTENVGDDVLLAVLLRSGVRGVNVADLARSLIEGYGSLTGLARAPESELEAVRGMGPVKAQVLAAAFELARRMAEEATPPAFAVRSPEDAARLLRDRTRMLEVETFWVLPLDARNRLKSSPRQASKGILDASLVHPREVFREAIQTSCAAVVIAHNHPSGDTTPSAEDIRITRQLIEAGRVVDIRVLDHVILGRADGSGAPDYCSMRESGVLTFT
jgi:DNA repair protein RadC